MDGYNININHLSANNNDADNSSLMGNVQYRISRDYPECISPQSSSLPANAFNNNNFHEDFINATNSLSDFDLLDTSIEAEDISKYDYIITEGSAPPGKYGSDVPLHQNPQFLFLIKKWMCLVNPRNTPSQTFDILIAVHNASKPGTFKNSHDDIMYGLKVLSDLQDLREKLEDGGVKFPEFNLWNFLQSINWSAYKNIVSQFEINSNNKLFDYSWYPHLPTIKKFFGGTRRKNKKGRKSVEKSSDDDDDDGLFIYLYYIKSP